MRDVFGFDWSEYREERYQRPRKVAMSRQECKARKLYWAPGDYVDLHAFRVRHPVELPDGRRFVTEECALKGLDGPGGYSKSEAARLFWKAQVLENAG